jgi:hypothetical protein
MLPPGIAEIIKEHSLFGYKQTIAMKENNFNTDVTESDLAL